MNQSDNTLELLEHIPASGCTYDQWMMVGMAIKESGYPLETWDNWSRQDERYEPGHCAKKWEKHFKGSSSPVTTGTLYHIAKEFGYTPERNSNEPARALGFDEAISADNDYKIVDQNWLERSEVTEPKSATWDQVGEIIRFLQTNFQADEHISFVNSGWQSDGSDKWLPQKSTNHIKAGQIISDLRRRLDENTPQEAIDLTFGDIHPEAGAWIRVNPMDGNGDRDLNVVDYRFALVESDEMEIEKQLSTLKELQLPVSTVVHSGGKSLHAWVRVDADNMEEYKERVNFLFEVCNKNGMRLDKQNRNPSRLSRLPGVFRGGSKQFIVATNTGLQSWREWKEWIEDENDSLPDFENFGETLRAGIPKPSDELIEGILRVAHKMLVAGPSKAGKSFTLIELCIAVAEGQKWLGFQCAQGDVLYLNLELDKRSVANRINDIYNAWGLTPNNADRLDVWNLRGSGLPLDKLAPKLIRRALKKRYKMIVIDPIYKVLTGSENDAQQMAQFTNLFDKIAVALNCSVVYCHHHSKGYQDKKRSSDRSSGSGVFARDPDAILDMIELHVSDDARATLLNERRAQTRCDFLDKYRPGWRDSVPQDDVLSAHKMRKHCETMLNENEQITLRFLLTDIENKVEKASGWRIESTLREFAKADPVNIWFDYPLHHVEDAILTDAKPEGEEDTWKQKNKKPPVTDYGNNILAKYWELKKINPDGNVKAEDIAKMYTQPGGGRPQIGVKKVTDFFRKHPEFNVDRGGTITQKTSETGLPEF